MTILDTQELVKLSAEDILKEIAPFCVSCVVAQGVVLELIKDREAGSINDFELSFEYGMRLGHMCLDGPVEFDTRSVCIAGGVHEQPNLTVNPEHLTAAL